jgi:hypothetical protein
MQLTFFAFWLWLCVDVGREGVKRTVRWAQGSTTLGNRSAKVTAEQASLRQRNRRTCSTLMRGKSNGTEIFS